MDSNSDPAADKIGTALNAQRFRMLEDIARDLSGDIIFPTCFDVALHMRKALQDSDLPLERIARVVGGEPLVAAKLMQLANSVFYSPAGNPVRDLQLAIGRLGFDLVRTTALAIAINQLMRSKEMVLFNDLTGALWDHSIKTAAAARVLARAHTRINPDEALVAGLVHDLGAFYMLYRAAQYPELRERPDTLKYLIMQWHESIGVSLLSALGMPEDIVNATIDHDRPQSVPEPLRTLAEVVHVANFLAGAHFEWLFQDFDPATGEPETVRQRFSELLPAIEFDAREMRAALA